MTVRRAPAAAVRQLHLAVELPAAGEGPGPRPDFAGWAALARAAERGLFDFLLLAPAGPAAYDGVAAGEDRPDGRGPEPVTVLHALAAVTTAIGLAVAVPAPVTGREPYDLARRIAVLDRLSGGRAGGPPGRFGEPAGPQGRPVAVDFGGTAEVLLTGCPSGGRRGGRRARVLSRFDLTADAAASAPAARELADHLHARVQSAATDGFVLRPDPAAAGHGLDAFVDRVVPLLQQHGSLRTAYTGTTLREHLGLPRPVG
ncbi:LLM class flavin-dependent oxidoreductase [Streptomyces sp. NBC_01477]|uniref:LLM class flavin-dependent oxidoreductase n=1 Tax=Streptomyces sp. NBC_01477 TaxID=2976015 RepID=UPI002E37342F|nr:LLM class flavin-dependent oxidoreductase [Streptomyces sp. NBC_01477]